MRQNNRRLLTLVLGAAMAGCLWSTMALTEDRHAGYYYPTPTSTEVYEARVNTIPGGSREARVEWVTRIVNAMASKPYPPQGAIFAKGDRGQKLIIVALVDGRMDTIYRIRAILANMTAATRNLMEFTEMDPQQRYWLTFLDFCKMMGFEQITLTDGRDFAHQIAIK